MMNYITEYLQLIFKLLIIQQQDQQELIHSIYQYLS